MTVLLVIAILNGDILETKRVYPIKDAKCEEIRDHPIVKKSWEEI